MTSPVLLVLPALPVLPAKAISTGLHRRRHRRAAVLAKCHWGLGELGLRLDADPGFRRRWHRPCGLAWWGRSPGGARGWLADSDQPGTVRHLWVVLWRAGPGGGLLATVADRAGLAAARSILVSASLGNWWV